MTKDQKEPVEWRDGVPVSPRFADPYYSLENGLSETRHVFLDGNDLPARFRPGFHIAELGFGTGLNMAAALIAWRDAGVPGPLRFTSFEAHPLAAADIETALAAFPQALEAARPILGPWAEGHRLIRTPELILQVTEGDARATLPGWDGRADAWFLDGFAPARNPELWDPALLRQVAHHTAPGGTAATYTAAGQVRRDLDAAGFDVVRVPGYGRKRHMTRAVLRSVP